MMKPTGFTKYLHKPLQWKSDGLFKRGYTLYDGDQPVAHLRQESGLFRSDASIYFAGAKTPTYILRPKGVFNTRVDVDSDDLDFEAAKLKPRTWGGGIAVDFLNGRHYRWERIDTWGIKWALTTADGFTVATLERNKWGSQGTITVVSDSLPPAELDLLIAAGWSQYLFEMQAAGAAG